MTEITRDKTREIITDFAKEIIEKKRTPSEPKKIIINFRNDLSAKRERQVWEVPIKILRYRKDNGRISSDVLSYEKNFRPLSEKDKEDQKILGDFLLNKDPEKTDELRKSLLHAGQKEPAIITCDGFLINGNRRKLALEMLSNEYPDKEELKVMKVVILPGKGEEGGPPTLREIEQIENRYQLQSEGKAEYYNFDRALSMRRKVNLGISLEEQLKDDPNFVDLSLNELKKEAKKKEDEFLKPLECVDKYLEYLDREGLYSCVSRGREGKEGRWQAFIDYYNYVHKRLNDDKKRNEMGITEEEVGKIEDSAFKIIRKRDIPDCGKVHMIMREFPKWLEIPEAKKEILKISEEVENLLPEKEKYDKDGNELDLKIIDKIWGEKNGTVIIRQTKKAKEIYGSARQAETPITLLDAVLKKLCHEKMDLRTIDSSDVNKAQELIKDIRDKIVSLEKEFYIIQKEMVNNRKLKKSKKKSS